MHIGQHYGLDSDPRENADIRLLWEIENPSNSRAFVTPCFLPPKLYSLAYNTELGRECVFLFSSHKAKTIPQELPCATATGN